MQTNKTNFSEDNIIAKNAKLLQKIELLNNNTSQFEEEIIDELINRKIGNNICCLKVENTNKNILSKAKSYKIKSKRISLSVDSKKEKRMKLKDWLAVNIENSKKIEEDIEELIIEIFVNRYNSYPEKDCPLSENALESKKQIEQFCPKFYEFSIYLLYVIYQKFNTFFEYLEKEINFKSRSINELNKIKEILFLTGIDIKKVFEKAFEKTNDFNLSNILIIMFDEYLEKENKIKICKEIKNSPFYKEKEKFSKYLKIVSKNIYFFDIESEIDKDKDKEEDNHKKNNLLNENKNIVSDKEDNNDNSNNNEEVKSETIIKIKEDNDINNQSDKENKQKNNDNNKKNQKIKSLENNNEKNILVQDLNIDDLLNYINDSDNKDKQKKRKKKKKGKKNEKNKIKEEEKEKEENEYIEKDLVFLNYKKALEEYTKKVAKTKKVKPIYSEEFLKKIQILSQ